MSCYNSYELRIKYSLACHWSNSYVRANRFVPCVSASYTSIKLAVLPVLVAVCLGCWETSVVIVIVVDNCKHSDRGAIDGNISILIPHQILMSIVCVY